MLSFFKRFLGYPTFAPHVSEKVDEQWLQQCDESIAAHRLDDVRTRLVARLAQQPDSAEILSRLSCISAAEGDYNAAVDYLDRSLVHADDLAGTYFRLGELHLNHKNIVAALDAFSLATNFNETEARHWLRLGDCQFLLEHHEDARQSYEKAVDHATTEIETIARLQLGQTLYLLRQFELSAQTLLECVKCDPDFAPGWVACGHVHLIMERDMEARTFYEKALTLTQNPDDSFLLNYAMSLQYCGDFSLSAETLEKVLARNPTNTLAKWYVCQLNLLLCRWQQGWEHFYVRFAVGASPFRSMPYKRWDGTPIPDKTLLILADQGIGDEIMFASCIQDVLPLVSKCILECEPRLHPLFQRAFPSVHVVSTEREPTTSWLNGLPSPDFQIFGGDLPGHFRRSDQAFPIQSAYLKPNKDRARHWRSRLSLDAGQRLKVGISWRGGTTLTRTRSRTISAKEWAPILQNPNCFFVNLQYGNYADELRALAQATGARIQDYTTELIDYDDTASLVSQLDLVVTVCTAIVHVSGALGTPVWVLTPFTPGWRYTAERDHMPWYTNSKIYRQDSVGHWGKACQILSEDLSRVTKNVVID